MNKDKDNDFASLLATFLDILKSRCDTCRYKQEHARGREARQQQNGRGNLKDDDKPEYTYFIRQRNYVKVGKSTDPVRRAEQIAHYTPFRVKLLYYTTTVTEAFVHREYQHLRKSGEWFVYTSELANYINVLIEKDKNAQEREAINSMIYP